MDNTPLTKDQNEVYENLLEQERYLLGQISNSYKTSVEMLNKEIKSAMNQSNKLQELKLKVPIKNNLLHLDLKNALDSTNLRVEKLEEDK